MHKIQLDNELLLPIKIGPKHNHRNVPQRPFTEEKPPECHRNRPKAITSKPQNKSERK